MNIALLYLMKSTLCMSVLYLVFRALMRKHTFFQLNRVILLSIVVFSIIIPLVHLPQAIQPAISYQLPPIANQLDVNDTKLSAAVISIKNEVVGQQVEATSLKFAISWSKLLQMIYLSGLFIALLTSLIGFLHILLLFRKVPVINKDGYWLHIALDDIPAFSFGRYLFISKSDFDTNGETILTHEKAHIRHVHFYDLLLLEVVKIVYWFNPVIYFLIRDLKAIHEFQADNSTLHYGIDATKYQLLIIQKCVGHQKFALANSFNHCQIKNRIVMMNKQKSQKVWRWMAAAFIPMLALLLMAFGRSGENVPLENSVNKDFSIQKNEVVKDFMGKSDEKIYPAGDVTEFAKFTKGKWNNWIVNQLEHFSEGKPEGWGYEISYSIIIDKDGKVRDGQIIKGCEYPEINAEFKQILTQIPDWKPARVWGTAVTVLYKEIIIMRSVEKK